MNAKEQSEWFYFLFLAARLYVHRTENTRTAKYTACSRRVCECVRIESVVLGTISIRLCAMI